MKWLLRGVITLLVLGVLGGGFAFWAYRQGKFGALPDLDGSLRAKGLQEPVEVLRDSWGIPHLYAKNHHDLVFAQGFVQAQDRWWQMDFYRRIFTGRMGELAGKNPDAQKVDVLMRTLNLKAVAQQDFDKLPPGLQEYYTAFCDGVNAYLDSRWRWGLALEYSLLWAKGVKPEIEPWTPADCLAFGKLMGYTFSGRDLEQEPLRALLEKQLNAAQWGVWEQGYPWGDHPTTIAREDLPQLAELSAPAPAPAEPAPSPAVPPAPAVDSPAPGATSSLMESLPWGMPGVAGVDASNAWAVSGARTESGKPLFASDPHQGIEIPNLWYEIGLHCPADKGRDALDLYGYAAPMLPFVQAGNNARICWGLTNVSGSDALDLFELRINPENPLQYEWDGAWRDMQVRDETITVADAEPITLQIRISHLGPVMPEPLLPEGSKDKAWAIHWAGLSEGTIQRAGIELVFARNFDEFHEALRSWDYPAANIPYADVDGNIGFQQVGKFPYGPGRGAIRGPMPGYSSTHEWEGFIDYELLPRVLNPASGLVVAANNPAAPEEYIAYLTAKVGTGSIADTSPHPIMGYRAKRITELLDQTPKHSIDTFKLIQNDVTTVEAMGVVRTGLARAGLPASEAVDLIKSWDGSFALDKPAALLGGLFLQKLSDNVFADELAGATKPTPDMNILRSLELMVARRDNKIPFWDNINTDAVETVKEIMQKSVDEAFEAAKAIGGPDPAKWSWGAVHQANFRNAFLGKSGVGEIEALVNRVGLPAPGAFSTVNSAKWEEKDGVFEMKNLPAYRRIVDLSDFSKSVAVNSTGQSGHPYSPNYADQLPLWIKGDYRPILWTREQVEAGAQHRLTLKP